MSDDPYARECMRRLNAQLLEAGLTLRGMTTQFDALLGTMRADLDAEARRGVAVHPDGELRHALVRLQREVGDALDARDALDALDALAALAALDALDARAESWERGVRAVLDIVCAI